MASDFNSADASTVNVGSGDSKRAYNPEMTSSAGVSGAATGDSAVRVDGDAYKTNTAGLDVGRTRVEGLDGPPSDAVAGGKKNTQGVTDTGNKDYGYPHKSDPSSGVDGPTRREV